MAVLEGANVTGGAAQDGVSRQTVRAWVARYYERGLAGLSDRSHGRGRVRVSARRRSRCWCASCAARTLGGVLWGTLNELQRSNKLSGASRASINRVSHRHRVIVGRSGCKKRSEYVRW